MASLVAPDKITNTFVREVTLADDLQWFTGHPEATVRHRSYIHGEFGFGPEVKWWLAEAEEARQQIRDLGWVNVEVSIILLVTRTRRGLHRKFCFVAVTNYGNRRGVGLVPQRSGGPRG